MGKGSSQPPGPHGGRVIGPPMSPTPSPPPGEVSDLNPHRRRRTDSDHQVPPTESKSPKKRRKDKNKKKRKKRHEGPDSDAANELSDAPTAVMPHDGDEAPTPTPGSAKKPKEKKRHSRKKHNCPHRPDVQDLLVTHAVGGSPPSAQEPAPNEVAGHAPIIKSEQSEEDIAMASGFAEEEGELKPFHPKAEPNRSPYEDPPDYMLPFLIGRVVDGDERRQESPFMHRREVSMVDDSADLQGDDEAPIPDLLLSQVKTELLGLEDDDNLTSPSVARLDRLERSRSRSISRPPPASVSAQSLRAHARLESPTPSRSSTGSNTSIPAHVEVARPASRVSLNSSARRDAKPNGDVGGANEDNQSLVNGHVIPMATKAGGAKSPNKTTSPQQVHAIMTEATDADECTNASASSTLSKTNVYRVTTWLSQPARRRDHEDVVEASDNEAAEQSGEAATHNAAEAQLSVDTEPPGDDEPEVPVHQPIKVKKKRRLQSKESLSLSQLEGDSEEGEAQPRMSMSQRSKLKEVMRGDLRSPEHETGTNMEQQTKPKRKRRPDAASEDEPGDLLAGPSRPKKPPEKSTNAPEPRRPKKAKVAPKSNRASQSETATGAWTTAELSALGRVVDQFRHAHDMSQSEINAMIHQRLDTGNEKHKDFWDSAVAAIQHRNRKQIIERTRRLYNNFVARGHWDDEQKKELHELFKKHGKNLKFSEIAATINRDQKDVRDYWRNHYVVDGHRLKWHWKPEETEKLKQAVGEALNRIRIGRENNDQFRPKPRAKGFDDESQLDWQQISSAMGLTRNRQQCMWKWQELKDKGEVRVDNDHLPEPSHRTRTINGLSEVLANAREDYRVMSIEEQLQLVEAVHDSGCSKDSKIKWKSLGGERFRAKWRRPTLKLVWFRLRKTVPDHEDQDVQSNARYLLNHYNIHQSLPRIEDNQADDEVEEKLVNPVPGSKVWQTPSQEPRALRERQRRSSSASSRASSRASKVSSQNLKIPDDDDEQGESTQRGRDHSPRAVSTDLGQDGVEGTAVEAGKGKARIKSKRKRTARSPPPPTGGWKSAAIAVDSGSE